MSAANVPVTDKKLTAEDKTFPTNTYLTLYCSKFNSVHGMERVARTFVLPVYFCNMLLILPV